MTAQRRRASWKWQNVFSQQRPPHSPTFTEEKTGRQAFQLTEEHLCVSVHIYISEHNRACHPGYSSVWLFWRSPLYPCSDSSLLRMRLQSALQCDTSLTLVANIVICWGFADLKMLAMADNFAGDRKLKAGGKWGGRGGILLNSLAWHISVTEQNMFSRKSQTRKKRL